LRSPLSILLSLVIFQIPLSCWAQSGGSAPQAGSAEKTQPLPGDRVVIAIGDEKITAAEVEKFIQALPPEFRAYYGGQGKQFLPQSMVRMKVLAAEAVKQKLEEQPVVARAIQTARASILADAAQKHMEQGISVNDQELQELYRKDKTLSEEVRIAHILIRTENAPFRAAGSGPPGLPEAEARKKLDDIRKQILAGADFARMAKQYSEDNATANSGGEMGYVTRERVIPPVMNAAYSLEPGQVSDILATPYGLEIIKVEEKHTKSFDEVRPKLESQIRQSRADEITQRLVERYHVVIDQAFFSGQPENPAPPTSPPSH
jgi:peptidyl-prolyl cis-trans isomerase C